jgi:hypothetical protein
MTAAQAADAEAAETTSYTSEPAVAAEGGAPAGGTLASDEALAELRRKLTGGDDEDAAAAPASDAAEAPAEASADSADSAADGADSAASTDETDEATEAE